MQSNFNSILLFGGSGFLGSYIKDQFDNTINAPSHSEIDLNNIYQTKHYIYNNKPEAIIYSAGITRIDVAQKDEHAAMLLNYEIPKNIAMYAADLQIPFFYISTDAVFDGYEDTYIFSENDTPKTKSIYGISKRKGEEAILERTNQNCVLRLITLYGISNSKPNFVSVCIEKLKNNTSYLGITDQIQNPTYIVSAAESIAFAVTNKLQGIYHIGALDLDTNYNFLIKLARIFDFNESLIKKTNFDSLMGDKGAFRKKNSVLVCDKFNKISNGELLKTIDQSLALLRASMQ